MKRDDPASAPDIIIPMRPNPLILQKSLDELL
jgi:hypothetical protein